MKTMIKHITSLIAVVLLLSSVTLEAQQSDTLNVRNEDLSDDLEDLTRANDAVLDFSDLVADYEYYREHPVNLNGPELRKLVELRLLNEAQLFSVESYIKNNGPLKSVYELKFIPGFGVEMLQRLANYVVAGKAGQQQSPSWKEIIRHARQELLVRFNQVPETVSGYDISPDSAFLKPGSVYLGTPQKLYFRYSLNAENRFRIGLTAEKDAGEVFLNRSFGDSVNRLLQHPPVFPDFVSAFAFVSDVGILKKFVAGDYHLEFGQGLTLWSGLTFGASAQTCQVKYFGKGIRPNTSANENRFFRGAALTLEKKDFQLTAFYSKKKYDANLLPPDSLGIIRISGLQETGYHRTINELQDKNALTITVYGGEMAFSHKRFRIGAVYYQTKLDIPVAASSLPYKIFAFQGNRLTDFGVNMNLNLNTVSFFGEMAANPSCHPAGIAGLNAFLSDRFTMTLLYRDYPRDYQNLFASPFAKTSGASNERGAYLGFQALLTRSLTLAGYADQAKFPWLKYGVDAPSNAKAYLLQAKEMVNERLSFYFRFRNAQNEQNQTDSTGYLTVPEPNNRTEYRLESSFVFRNFLILKDRIEFVDFREQGNHQHGLMVYQDVKFRKENSPWQLTLRYAFFHTEGWDSRIYTYEENALYAFSVPALYGRGERMYLLLRWGGIRNLRFWLRAATTRYFDRQTVGSGAETVHANHKSELTCELQWKF